MPSLKEVRNRIKSVQSTQQITKAMKMVAAAKLRKAQDQAMQFRPYSAKMAEILQNLTSGSEAMATNPFVLKNTGENVLLVVITSDRGLCGPFNSNILKTVNQLIINKYADLHAEQKLHFLCIGKKGYEFLQKRYANVNGDFATYLQGLSFEKTRKVAEFIMNKYLAGEYGKVEIIYNEFKNVATQLVKTDVFLPLTPSENHNEKTSKDYIFEPSVDDIINDLVPRTLKTQFYKCLLESNASEHGARMTAMDKATENAGELLKSLKIQYNRSRQASITKEILEIVGGAEALAAK